MNKEEKEFCIPDSLIEQLYELSGNADAYKGMILCLSSENGQPMIYSKFESVITEMGLRKALESFLTDLNRIDDRFSNNPLD